MSGKTIEIKVPGASGFTGYLATAEAKKAPGIILIQEIFGVNSHIRSVADLYALAGFNVIAPDVFWRVQPAIELGYTPEDIRKGMSLASKLNPDQVIADLQAAGQALRDQPGVGTKMGTVGYCMGGTYAYRLATHDAVDCAIAYYGGGIDKYLDEAKNLHCPVMFHFGKKDSHIPLSTVEKIGQAVARHGHTEIYVYDADHGFNCDQRASYDRTAAMLAFARSYDLLKKNLC